MIAKKYAEESTCIEHRHGALLIRGGSVLNGSNNQLKPMLWANKFREYGCGHAARHAELGAILNVHRSKTKNATVYVVRINKRGDFRLSKPCNMCQKLLRHVGVKRVVYTIDNNTIACFKL
jgi:deoxycytidylate deaminase